MNGSLASIRAGLRTILQQTLGEKEYFLFRNGQVRRQIGQGHSEQERARRRDSRQLRRLAARAERKYRWAKRLLDSLSASAA